MLRDERPQWIWNRAFLDAIRDELGEFPVEHIHVEINRPDLMEPIPENAGSSAEAERMIEERCHYLVRNVWGNKRHTQVINGEREMLNHELWIKFNGKERMKTVSVALTLCLHLGIEPPDQVQRPRERARIEAWIDPAGWSSFKAASAIGCELQEAFRRFQPRARYKIVIDPTLDEVKKVCNAMRRNAKDERVLFYYNGHGVPRPTKNGEIWAFNQGYTQYMPISISSIQTWIEFPSIYVWDVNSAGTCIESFKKFADQHMTDWENAFEDFKERTNGAFPPITAEMSYIEQARVYGFVRPPNFQECIHLAACGPDETLPFDPRLPADLFTSCLTTPIQTSILWYLIKKNVRSNYPDDIFAHISGQFTDRRSLMGELNWIFTAITDTIAWNVLPRDLFQKLFRQDLLLASLFRSYLLAEKVMGTFGCTTQSVPKLPKMEEHSLWLNWEVTLDYAIDELYKSVFMKDPTSKFQALCGEPYAKNTMAEFDLVDSDEMEGVKLDENWFFVQQMKAFRCSIEGRPDPSYPPEQLPVILQVLLSQQHRVQALELLSNFLDIGTWAIEYALSVGIFPYILKLLQSTQRDLKAWLSFIWAKILVVEPAINIELLNEICDESSTVLNVQQIQVQHKPDTQKSLRVIYFLQFLNDPLVDLQQKVVVAYVLSQVFKIDEVDTTEVHQYLVDRGYVTVCTEILLDNDAYFLSHLRCWLLFGMAHLWADFNTARWQAVRLTAHQRAISELTDHIAEVRACACFALGHIIKNHSHTNEHATVIDQECADAILKYCLFDGSLMVREEMILALQYFVLDFEEPMCKYYLSLLKLCDLNIETEMLDEEIDDEPIDVTAEIDALEREKLRDPMLRSSNPHSIKRVKFDINMFRVQYEKTLTRTHGQAALSNRDRKFKKRIYLQIADLESRQFLHPFHRIWLGMLRLSLDAMPKIAMMAQILVRRIEEAALEYYVSTERRLVSSAMMHSFNVKTRGDRDREARGLSRENSAASIGTSQSAYPSPARKLSSIDIRKGLPPISTSPRRSVAITATSPPEASDGEESGIVLKIDHSASTPTFAWTNGNDQQGTSQQQYVPEPKPAMKNPLKDAPAGARAFLRWKQLQGPELLQLSDFDRNAVIAMHHHFVPKRTLTGRIGGAEFKAPNPHPKIDDVHPIIEPMLVNDYEDWMSCYFSKPCVQLVMEKRIPDEYFAKNNTLHHPNFWCQKTQEVAANAADVELNQLLKRVYSRKPQKSLLRDTSAHSNMRFAIKAIGDGLIDMTFSRLRPYLFLLENNIISMYRYENTNTEYIGQFHNYGGNDFMSDTAMWIENLNPQARELIMVGSSDGTVRVWDPCFDRTSDRLMDNPSLVSAFRPLADKIRYPFDSRRTTDICNRIDFRYNWDQPSGQLLVSGRCHTVRLWDAHYEKPVYDVAYPMTTSTELGDLLTSIDGEMGISNLFAIGFRSGLLHLYDQRVPQLESRAMEFTTGSCAVKSCALRTNNGGPTRLFVGQSNGGIQVYEPRMFREPIYCIKSSKAQSAVQYSLAVHRNGQLMLSDTMTDLTQQKISLFDNFGVHICPIVEASQDVGMRGMQFHPLRPLVGVVFKSGFKMYNISYS